MRRFRRLVCWGMRPIRHSTRIQGRVGGWMALTTLLLLLGGSQPISPSSARSRKTLQIGCRKKAFTAPTTPPPLPLNLLWPTLPPRAMPRTHTLSACSTHNHQILPTTSGPYLADVVVHQALPFCVLQVGRLHEVRQVLRQQPERLLAIRRRPRGKPSGTTSLRDPRHRPQLPGEQLPLVLLSFKKHRQEEDTNSKGVRGGVRLFCVGALGLFEVEGVERPLPPNCTFGDG